jgi:predicted nucleic acid-binding protein
MSPVFVDTGAFYALAARDDQHHGGARRALRRLARERRRMVTSTYVVDEAITLLRRRLGHAGAVRWGEQLAKTSWCEVVEVDQAVRQAAWQIFVRYRDQEFSFTHCTSFALMRSMDLREAFTFDGHFQAAGFVEIPARR